MTQAVLSLFASREAAYHHRGIGRYACTFASNICRIAPEAVVRVQVPERPEHYELLNTRGVPVVTEGSMHPPVRDQRSGRLVYHVMAPFDRSPLSAVWPHWARQPEIALAVTLYDLIPLRFPSHYLTAHRLSYLTRLELLRSADAVLAISQASADEAVELAGIDRDRVHVVGIASSVRRPAALELAEGRRQVDALVGATPRPIATVAGDDDRKNSERLVEAFAGLPRGQRVAHPLVFVGELGKGRTRRLIAQAKIVGADDGLVVAGRISDGALWALYERSALAVFPSLAEGFGLPVLEAIEAGVPVVASDIPSVREILPKSEARFDPRSVEAIRDALSRGLHDAGVRARLRDTAGDSASAYSWEKVVERSLSAYGAASARRSRTDPGARRSRAVRHVRPERAPLPFVTPLPPARSGVAFYSARLLKALERVVPVEVFEDRAWENTAHRRRAGARQLPIRRAWSGAIDRAPLVSIGNSGYHLDGWMTLMRDGGDVLLHDVRLVGLYTLLGQRGALGWEGVRGRVRRFEGVDDEDVFGPDVLMVGEVVDRARKILVYNSAARDLVLTRRPDRADDVHVVPFAHPAPAPDPRPAPTCPRFATFGHLKDVEWLLGKIGPALRSVPDAQLTFVGPEPVPGDLATAVDTTRRTGLSHKVTFTGWVDDRSYRKYLSESTAAIQIRRIDQGETSAAVADCLAAGLPTIANEVGGIRDLPHDVVARVHSDPAPAELTAHLSRLARDEDRWRSLAGNGLSYAASHGATAAALAIVECIGDRG